MFLIRPLLRLARLGLVLALILVLAWFFREPLLNSAAHLWVIDDSVTHADAAIVLGGGRDWRPFAAAEILKSGVADRILVAQVSHQPSERALAHASETEVNLAVLAQLGVPPDRIGTFGTSVTSTRDEAASLREWAQTNRITSVVIPTDPFHTRRVKWIFERQLAGTGVTVFVKAVPHPDHQVERWWTNETGFLTFQNELLKSLYYRLKY